MKDFAFDKTNYVILGIGMVIIILGFCLMAGSGSNEANFNPEIFSVRRIRVAPVISLIGFLTMIYGIMHKPKTESEQDVRSMTEEAEEKKNEA